MKGVILGAVVGGLVMFVWGFVFFGVLPTSSSVIKAVDNQAEMQQLLKDRLPGTGVYMVPFAEDASDTEFQALHTQGPIVTIQYREEGGEPMAPGTFMLGYFHEVLVLLIMGLLLKITGIDSYGGRLAVVFLGGVAGSMFATMSAPIWWLQPWSMPLMDMLYQSVAWFLAGLVVAGMVKPTSQSTASDL